MGMIQRYTKQKEVWKLLEKKDKMPGIYPGTIVSTNTYDSSHLTAAQACWVSLWASQHKEAASSKSAIKHAQHKSTFIFCGLH